MFVYLRVTCGWVRVVGVSVMCVFESHMWVGASCGCECHVCV